MVRITFLFLFLEKVELKRTYLGPPICSISIFQVLHIKLWLIWCISITILFFRRTFLLKHTWGTTILIWEKAHDDLVVISCWTQNWKWISSLKIEGHNRKFGRFLHFFWKLFYIVHLSEYFKSKLYPLVWKMWLENSKNRHNIVSLTAI